MDTHTTTPQPIWKTLLWMGHWALRYLLAGVMLVYGWSKVVLGQFGTLDYSNALTQYGEMSPMGLFWRFFGYSEFVQITSGLVEVLAAALLLFHGTAWLGGLLMTAACGAVFAFNMAYDIPVKQNSLAYTVMGLLIVLPYVPVLLRMLRGRGAPPLPTPRPIPWPKVRRVTRWVGGALAVLMIVGSALPFVSGAFYGARPTPVDSELPGVYRVVADSREPAAQLAEDTRWQMVSFGELVRAPGATAAATADGGTPDVDAYGEDARTVGMELRLANGDYRSGIATIDGDVLHVELKRPRAGDFGTLEQREDAFDLDWTADGPDRIALTGETTDGTPVDVTLEIDPELQYLHHNEMHWWPDFSNGAINR
ncbi:hypothetical protein [Brevibacterium litoralis]|uniref:hypothetical protein n=1 Tax=Brevibacterium litoralis TaxID=3138935 RepID=UPI0032EDC945